MKKGIIVSGIIVVLLGIVAVCIGTNLFGSRNWFAQNLLKEHEEEAERQPKEKETDVAGKANTIQPLITELIEESESKGEWEELLKKLAFPTGSYLTGYYVESSKHSVSGGQDFSYSFRIIIPADERNFYSTDYQVFPSVFGEVKSEDALYSLEHIYGLYNDGYRTSGIISVCIIDADNDCIVLIQA